MGVAKSAFGYSSTTKQEVVPEMQLSYDFLALVLKTLDPPEFGN